DEEVLQVGEEMVQKYPDSPWGYFLIIEAYGQMPKMTIGYPGAKYNFRRPAMEAAEKMIALAPVHPDIIWMYAKALYLTGNENKAIEFVDSTFTDVSNPAELLVIKAKVLQQLVQKDPSEKKIAQVDSLFEKALELDSTCVSALFSRARYDAKDTVLVKKALAISPNSNAIHSRYWHILINDKKMDVDKKIKIIEKDMNAFLGNRSIYPMALFLAGNIYSPYELDMPEKAKIYNDKILKNFPGSPAAEWMRVYEIRALQKILHEKEPDAPMRSPEYRQMLRDFIDSPYHSHKGLLFEQYRNLFNSIKDDSTVAAEELLDTVQQMAKLDDGIQSRSIVEAANALSDNTEYYAEAEQIAREGLDRYRSYIRRQFPEDMSDEEFEKNIPWNLAPFYDAIGWAQFKSGAAEKAEINLLKSHSLAAQNRDNLYHLGQLFESKQDDDKAREFYGKGLEIQRPEKNPNEAALKALCEKVDGDTGYIDKILDRQREARRKETLSSRISNPEPAPKFSLKTLDAETISLDDLKGKTVVVNFWGIWCYWCVKELDELQLLHEKYADDPNVVVLSINNDTNPDDVPPFMEKHGYNFPVLLDDGFVGKADIHSFPTTWFIDQNGKIVYIKPGWTKELVFEFSWRIEDIRS
ncbi:redoxin domain-containing protein, partial [candidate division KSB1 bacterium]|nr:redoxin domain-containing protein [candidate division KSB1 bacterium]